MRHSFNTLENRFMGNYNPDSHRLPRTMSLRYSGLISTCLLCHRIRFVKKIMNDLPHALFSTIRFPNDSRFLDGFARIGAPLVTPR